MKKPGSRREQPAVRELEAVEPGRVLKKVARHFGLEESKLIGKRTGHRDERGVAMELMYRYGGLKQVRIGELLGGLDYTAVSRERKRLRERVEANKALKTALEKIETSLLS
jgi:chromosomal replication initiation ATPase DnaA